MIKGDDMKFTRKQQGFTLIELSVVIVIIGLLIIGVMAGRDLIRQATLRQTMIKMKSMEIAIKQFEEKYFEFPGDIPNATSHFSSSYVKNGDGDGILAESLSYINPSDAQPQESAQALVHLSQAGLIPGSFTGVGPVEAGVTVAEGGGGRVLGLVGKCANPHFGRNNLNAITVGYVVGVNNCFWCYSSFSVWDAKSIDTKLDDGVANTGLMYAVDGDGVPSGDCSANHGVVAGADYNTSNNDSENLVCRIFYYLK